MAPDPNPTATTRYFCVPPASDLQYLPRVGSFNRQQCPFGRSVDTEVRMTQQREMCHAEREWLAEREADITHAARRLLQLVDPELPVELDEPLRGTVRRVMPDMPEATLPVNVHVEGAGVSSEAAIFVDTPTTSAPTSPRRVEPVDVTFTTVGTEGHTAPTKIGAHYNGMQLGGKVTLVEGYHRWKVPYTRRYRIEAHGAASHRQRGQWRDLGHGKPAKNGSLNTANMSGNRRRLPQDIVISGPQISNTSANRGKPPHTTVTPGDEKKAKNCAYARRLSAASWPGAEDRQAAAQRAQRIFGQVHAIAIADCFCDCCGCCSCWGNCSCWCDCGY